MDDIIEEATEKARLFLPIPSKVAQNEITRQLSPCAVASIKAPNPLYEFRVSFRKQYVDGICIGWELIDVCYGLTRLAKIKPTPPAGG